jgi:hypothetical protein
MHLSRELRRRLYYSVPTAGAKVGWSRSESYRRAAAGDLPVEIDGGLLLVPKKPWDKRVRKQLRGLRAAGHDV